MKRLTVMLAAGLAASCAESPVAPIPPAFAEPAFAASISTVASPAAGFTSQASVPLSLSVYVSCAAGGAGEVVDLAGSLHILTHVTLNAAGGYVFRTHSQPQGVSGSGATTGTKYQGTGVTQETTHAAAAGLPYTHTAINNFRIIGRGPDNNYLVHVNTHVTVNANGDVTAEVSHASIECR
jgi:hypothetical protein